MKILKRMAVAFSIYSKIPMPIFDWTEEDLKYNLVFLPFVGLIIGGVTYGLWYLMNYFQINLITEVMLTLAIPLIVTGGIHLDGFIDVEDAISSYASKEKRLEILKDPHIGAFAVIGLAKIGLCYIGAMAIVLNKARVRDIIILSIMYVISRAACAYISISFQHAKKDGMLNMETKATNKIEKIIVVIEIVISLLSAMLIDYKTGLLITISLVLYTLYYRNKCYKNFGGITGDMSGYFIVVCELIMIICIASIKLIEGLYI